MYPSDTNLGNRSAGVWGPRVGGKGRPVREKPRHPSKADTPLTLEEAVTWMQEKVSLCVCVCVSFVGASSFRALG